MPGERILVIQLRQLGDILLTTPCLRALKTAPQVNQEPAEVVVLTHPMGRLILEGNPDVDEHLTYDPGEGLACRRREWDLARSLRARRFDLVIDFMSNPRSAFYAWATGAPRRFGYISVRAPAYTQTIGHLERVDYIVRDKFRMLRAAGYPARDERLLLPWTDSDAQIYHEFAASTPALRSAPLRVILSPTHRRPARRWPLQHFAKIADHLSGDWGAAVVWLYGPGEEEYVDRAQALCTLPTYKMPPASFRGMAALVAHMDLFIGNSNGPSHVAVANDVPSLQLHGPTDAIAWCPQTERHHALQSPDFGRVKEPDISRITIEAVRAELALLRPVVTAEAAARRARLILN